MTYQPLIVTSDACFANNSVPSALGWGWISPGEAGGQNISFVSVQHEEETDYTVPSPLLKRSVSPLTLGSFGLQINMEFRDSKAGTQRPFVISSHIYWLCCTPHK
ncbi:phosphatidylinositol 4-kinase beta [Platysternon megacephalum]|uniref:Phosphatidylinositol 4-kinase beta n=1 Tax=Platysternon megacephalum TaxID=55544 RepID=A0A4D9EIT3_9SAUR|nr:phosphatidylinositol 4-kinase beta [Platysternon megacephalum]